MSALRHSSRHVHHSVAEHLSAALTTLKWVGPANDTPFGAPVVTVTTSQDTLGSKEVAGAKDGSLFVSLGPEQMPVDEEVGGPLAMTELVMFVDVFMAQAGHAQALIEDVRDVFLGRLPAPGPRSIPVVNQVTSTVVEGWRVEFVDLEQRIPDRASALHWRVLALTCEIRYREGT